jgi:hypothetical protein
LCNNSELFNVQFSPKWFSSKVNTQESLKKQFCDNPCEALVHQLFPDEFQQVFNKQKELDLYQRLPILYILLRALILEEENIILSNHEQIQLSSWDDFIKLNSTYSTYKVKKSHLDIELLFYLVMIFLDDLEAQIVKNIFKLIVNSSQKLQ